MSEIASEGVRASVEIQDPLLLIVRELLKNQQVGPDHDFFLAGGHSLLGTELAIRARKTFGVKVSVNDLFEAGTVAKLAIRIEELMLKDIAGFSDMKPLAPSGSAERRDHS